MNSAGKELVRTNVQRFPYRLHPQHKTVESTVQMERVRNIGVDREGL